MLIRILADKHVFFKWGAVRKVSHILEQIVCVSLGKQIHLGSRGHWIDQKSCLTAQHVYS